MMSRLGGAIKAARALPSTASVSAPPELEIEEPEPEWLGGDDDLMEFGILLQGSLNVARDAMGPLLENLSLCREPLSFEIIGTSERVTAQFVARERDAPTMRRQLASHLPEATFLTSKTTLGQAWGSEVRAESVFVDFALAQVFMWPLASSKSDPYVGLIGSLSELASDEVGVFQVIFSPLSAPWGEHAWRAVTNGEGNSFFPGGADLVKATGEKVSRPLYGVVVRIATRSPDFERSWEIARGMASSLRGFTRGGGQSLMPLNNDEYPPQAHEVDLLRRQSRRSGMILNEDELVGFVHFPTPAVRSSRFARLTERTRSAPQPAASREGVCLGFNEHAGRKSDVWLTTEQRVRHLHVIGGTGTGKSTLLCELIRQDLEAGEGVAVLDPHGDLVDKVLGMIPQWRRDDVVLLDPSDEAFSVGFNVLSAHSDFEKTLLASDLIAVFQRLSTSWGDQMNSVFQNAILAMLESPQGGTLADLRRFLLDASWRGQFLQTVSDPDVRYYWNHAFPQLGGNKSIGPILTRLDMFLSPKPIRYMVSQQENKLDFGDIMDSGKIFLAKLPQGQMGRENAFLLGSLLVTKLQQMAMSRQRMAAAKRRAFFCYIDEFQHFITPSMAEILSGARKYRLGLILAHQELRQLERDREVASAVLSNAFTRVVFRVGDADARALAEGFAHFEARDVQSLEIGKAICRIERADNDFNLSIPLPEEPNEDVAAETRLRAIEASRARYATPRAEVEAMLLRKLEAEEAGDNGGTKPVSQRKRDEVPASPGRSVASEAKSGTGEVGEVGDDSDPNSMENQTVEPRQEQSPAQNAARAVPDQGKGGHQHRILQERIKSAAERCGFRAVLEMPVGSGRESVDVGLIRGGLRIACEISSTTTIDQEVGNARKCLREGFGHVAVITTTGHRLEQLADAMRACFPADEFARIGFYEPEKFIAYIETLPVPEAPPSTPTVGKPTRRGYTVKRTYSPLTPEERRQREEQALREIAEELRRPPTEPDTA